jgi:hypothetical protein
VTSLVFFSGPLVITSPSAAFRYSASDPSAVSAVLVDVLFMGTTARRSYM